MESDCKHKFKMVCSVCGYSPGEIPNDEVIGLVKRGDRLGAIKKYCEKHRCGLYEAKNAVDKLIGSTVL